jgi:UDP-N-acetylglucosamine:LPS N-acetylglucosamine transferase
MLRSLVLTQTHTRQVGSGGGGHKATARALTEACAQARKDFDFEVIDCALILGLGATVGDGLYNWLMSSGRAQWIPALHQLGYHMTTLNQGSVVEMFRAALAKTHADLVVSCCPHINHAIADAVAMFRPAPPLVTLMSDFENSVDHPWMQDHRQHIICGTENAIKQTIALGHPRDRVYGTSGMIVHPSFYRPLAVSVTEGRRRLQLRPEWRTVCVFFGGFAPTFLPKIIRIIMGMPVRAQRSRATVVVYVCTSAPRLTCVLRSAGCVW